MPRIAPTRGRRSQPWIRPVLHQLLGLGKDEHVNVLKGYLAAAGFRSRDGKIDLILVESLEHFEELMAGGIPLARSEETYPVPGRRGSIRRAYLYVLVAGAFLAPAIWRWPTLLGQLGDQLF